MHVCFCCLSPPSTWMAAPCGSALVLVITLFQGPMPWHSIHICWMNIWISGLSFWLIILGSTLTLTSKEEDSRSQFHNINHFPNHSFQNYSNTAPHVKPRNRLLRHLGEWWLCGELQKYYNLRSWQANWEANTTIAKALTMYSSIELSTYFFFFFLLSSFWARVQRQNQCRRENK